MRIVNIAMISLLACAAPAAGEAQEMSAGIFRVAPQDSQRVSRHGVCRIVTNRGGAPIMVPAGTPPEWFSGSASFISNVSAMPGVSVTPCPPRTVSFMASR